MLVNIFCGAVVTILLFIISVTGSKVLRQSSQNYQSTLYAYPFVGQTFCRTVPGLTKHQIEVCYQEPDATAQALQGLNQAVKECQFQFQGHRWNCSSLSTRGKNPYISAMLQKGSQCASTKSPKITRKELFLVLKGEGFFKMPLSDCNERVLSYILEKNNIDICPSRLDILLKKSIKTLVSKLVAKWKESHYVESKFLKKYSEWLKKEFVLPKLTETCQIPAVEQAKGRPKKSFNVSSVRTKQRSVQSLVQHISPEQLTYAAESSLVKSGRRTTAKVMKLTLDASPGRLKKMRDVTSNSFNTYTPEEALALIVDTDLTKEDYIKIQRGAKLRGANLYPPYNVISQAKKTCYPENIIITESEARIPLQNLLDLTVNRLFEVQREVIMMYLPTDVTTIDVFYKWGLDGSGGHSIYKQAFQNSTKYSDSNIILSTIVPLEISVTQEGKKRIFWQNYMPSSTKYCRPICFKMVKETNITVTEEYDNVEKQLQKIQPTTISLTTEKDIQFHHTAICTMMDGKTCNVLTSTSSSQACNICKVTPKDINDLDKVLARASDVSAYKFGISILHAYLRCFEYLLHIAYKMESKQWQARGDAAKNLVKERKSQITSSFYEKMGLIVDQPKQGGGNTNDGNTARKFFANPSLVSQIIGLNENLIKRFANILITISSGHNINTKTFKPYCFETAKLCISLYGWYKMSASVHKLLIHSSDIIDFLPLPVGQLSEDVLEASQKEYKNIRLFHSRKTSREDTNADIIHWMLINSDPLISSKRGSRKRLQQAFNEDVLLMLSIPEYLQNVTAVEEFSDEDDNNQSDSH